MDSKRIIVAVACVLVLVTGLVVTFKFSANDEKSNVPQGQNDLPQLIVIKADGESLALREVSDKAILIFFNPDCDHCQREAREIGDHKDMFRDYSLYFISTEPLQILDRFATEYNLTGKNFIIAQASGNDVYNAVGPLPSVPAIFIYSGKRLMKRFDGEVAMDEIQKFL